MKGMMLISFWKTPGAFVEVEYPKGLKKEIGFDGSDINLPYSVQRMRNMKPNYTYVKVRDIMVASFFSGFDFKDYVGFPNKCIYLILDDENPNLLEDKLVRIAADLLPKFKLIDSRNSPYKKDSPEFKEAYEKFERLFKETYFDLLDDNIEPLKLEDVEIIVGKGSTISTSDGEHTGKVKEVNVQPKKEVSDVVKKKVDNAAQEIVEMSNQIEEMERESLKQEILRLKNAIKQKDERIQKLESKLQEVALNTANKESEEQIKSTIEGLNNTIQAKEEELDKWRGKVAEINEKLMIHKDTISKMTEMSMMQSDEMQAQSRQIINLKDELDKIKPELTAAQEKMTEQESKIKQLETDLIEAQHSEKMSKYTAENQVEKISFNVSNGDNISEEAISDMQHQFEEVKSDKKKLEMKINEYKSQIIHLKKEVKIQRREIQSLKEKIEKLTI